MSDCKRILYIHGNILLRGGAEAYMMNYYRHFDHDKLQVDFVVHGLEKGVYDDEIEAMGGKIYRIPTKGQNLKGNLSGLQRIFSSGEYQLVHSHMDTMNALVLMLARKCGIPIRISHSHSTFLQTQNKIKIWAYEKIKKAIPMVATHLFACSGMAGDWLYGKRAYQVVPNAVSIERFAFDAQLRQRIRRELNLQEKDIVLGHVGRFGEEKNHKFLIAVLQKLRLADERYKLVLVGDGPLKEAILAMVAELGLEDAVRFVPACPNVNEYYNAFDCFCLPSVFEGLPTVGIEAQINGLRCVISDTVSRELDKSGNTVFLRICEQGVEEWAQYFLSCPDFERDENAPEKLRDAGYDIKGTAAQLQNEYLAMMEQIQIKKADRREKPV